MNTANLQLAGVLAALGAVLDLMKAKGLVSGEEVEETLAAAEAELAADPGRSPEISRANVEAALFPLRYLRAANGSHGANGVRTAAHFSELATLVGRRRPE